MRYIRNFFSFWYHFIVGDDWRIAVGVVISLGLTALAVHSLHDQNWWLLPLLIIILLTLSLWRATKKS